MKLRFSTLFLPAAHAPRAGKHFRRLCVGLAFVMGVAGVASNTAAAPKAKATPTATPTPAPTPPPASSPTAEPTATPAATPSPTANYSGTQQTQYISTARDAFVALRTEKSQPFLDAHKALDAAGGVSAKGLKTKEDIAARRDLLAKTSAANDQYLEFVKTQDDTYRTELAKTPLIPNDVDGLVKEFDAHANTSTMIKLRETERDALKAGDDMLAILDKKIGAWTTNDAGKISFKKKADVSAFGGLAAKYNASVAELQKLREALTPPPSASPSPAVAPGATPAANAASAPGAVPPATPAAGAKP